MQKSLGRMEGRGLYLNERGLTSRLFKKKEESSKGD